MNILAFTKCWFQSDPVQINIRSNKNSAQSQVEIYLSIWWSFYELAQHCAGKFDFEQKYIEKCIMFTNQNIDQRLENI